MQHVSSSPSKIPYGGFSPVRLQAGLQPRSSLPGVALKREARIRVTATSIYAAKAEASAPNNPEKGQAPTWGVAGLGTTAASPEALGSPAGYAIPQGPRLLWPHPSLSRPSAGLFPSSGWSLPYGLVWAGRERFPTFLRLSVPPCHLPYPGVPDGCIWLLLRRPPWPSPSWHRLGSRWPTRSGSGVGGVTRLQSSLHAAARWIARSSPARAFTPELAPPGSPLEDVGYDYAGKQPTPAAGLSPARHAAPWAASQDAKAANVQMRNTKRTTDNGQLKTRCTLFFVVGSRFFIGVIGWRSWRLGGSCFRTETWDSWMPSAGGAS